MKIAIIGANGAAGSLIVKEAVERGHDVTAIVRSENRSVAKNVINKDLFDLSREDLAGFDAVVSAFAAWREEDLPLHSKAIEKLSSLLEETNTRLLVVGGAGSLYVDENKTTRLVDSPDFPAEYKPLALAMAEALDLLRTKDIAWTFISPAADFVVDAPKTNSYDFAGEIFTTNKDGISQISYADYASAMLDEIESAKNLKARISVFGK